MALTETVRESGRVDAAPAAVWAYLSDPQRMVGLNPDLIAIRDLAPAGPMVVGQSWVERTRTPLGEQEVQTQVLAVDQAGGRIRLEGRGPLGVRIDGTMQLRAEGAGTAVILEHRLTVPGGPLTAGPALALLSARVRQGSRAALRRLAAGLQRQA